jgi:hypothetical protein
MWRDTLVFVSLALSRNLVAHVPFVSLLLSCNVESQVPLCVSGTEL